MSLETMSFILGGILLASSVFGGGLEIKELRLPQIGTLARVFSAVVGVGFIVLAIYLNPPPPDPEPPRKEETFQKPMHGNLRLDVCQQFGRNCGEPAATAWCKTRGFTRAKDFETEKVGAAGIKTRLIGTDQVCQGSFCTSFTHITCEL